MTKTETLSWAAVKSEAALLADRWRWAVDDGTILDVFGVPMGGVAPALIVADRLRLPMTDLVTKGTLVVDDLVDSGATAAGFGDHHFDALFRKPHSPMTLAHYAAEVDGWIVFPWEQSGRGQERSAEDAVVRLLQAIGEDPTRDGLRDTPRRVVKSMREFTSGTDVDVAELLGVTFDVAHDEMIAVTDIEVVSTCEHHLLPFTGLAHVAYIPTDRVVGLSKIARTVDAFARRLQVQERLTGQIADALVEHLAPSGVGVIIEASHSCMSCRGVRKPGARMVTSAMRGVLLSKPEARAEFLALSGKS